MPVTIHQGLALQHASWCLYPQDVIRHQQACLKGSPGMDSCKTGRCQLQKIVPAAHHPHQLPVTAAAGPEDSRLTVQASSWSADSRGSSLAALWENALLSASHPCMSKHRSSAWDSVRPPPSSRCNGCSTRRGSGLALRCSLQAHSCWPPCTQGLVGGPKVPVSLPNLIVRGLQHTCFRLQGGLQAGAQVMAAEAGHTDPPMGAAPS